VFLKTEKFETTLSIFHSNFFIQIKIDNHLGLAYKIFRKSKYESYPLIFFLEFNLYCKIYNISRINGQAITYMEDAFHSLQYLIMFS